MAPTLSDLTGHYPILCSLFAHLEIHDIFNIARTCKQSWDHICVDEDNFDNLITKTACKGRGETWGTDEGPGGLLYIHHYRDNARHHAENIACDHAEKRVCETCKHTICKSCKFRHWDALAMYALPRDTYPPFLIHHEEPQVIQYRAVHDMWFCKSCVPKRFGWTARQMTPCDCRDGELWWYKEEYAGDCARCYDCRRKELADRVNAAHDFFRDNAGARRWLESGNGERHNVLVKSCEWCETSVGEEKFIVVCPQCWKRAKRHRSARPPNRTYDWYTFELGNEDENEENGVQEENDVQDQNSVHEDNNAEGDNSARREDSVQGKRTAGQMLLRARKALANMCRSLSRHVRE